MLTDRHRTALEMRQAGATYQAIGHVFGVSAARASVIYQRAVILRTELKTGLSTRARGILERSPQSPKEWAAMLSRDRQAAFVALLRLPSCGRRDAEEILGWLEAGNLELT
jgi:hypothetical protein